MNKWTAIIMAAGSGKRMRSAKPKVLHELAGKSMILHVVSAIHRAKPDQIIIVIPQGSIQDYANHLGDFEITFTYQNSPLGTGDSVAIALEHVQQNQGDLIVVNGDSALLKTETILDLKNIHNQEDSVVTLTTARVSESEAEGLGILIKNTDESLIEIKEYSEFKGNELKRLNQNQFDENVGLYAFNVPWIKNNISKLVKHTSGEYLIGDLLSIAINDKEKVTEFMSQDMEKPIGVNDQQQLAAAELEMQTRLRSHWLSVGVSMADPSSTYFGVDVQLSAGTFIGHNTALRGKTVVGKGVQIGPNAVIEDSVIADNVSVGSSYLNGVTVGSEVIIENFNTLRQGTKLADRVKIGNHVEIKDSTIGADTFIRHFSYIGDSILGERVNVGAGVVTCNYDGSSKHKTFIGDDVFLGSGTMLVAPIKIGEGAKTGAGSVVTKDIDAGVTVAGVPAKKLSR